MNTEEKFADDMTNEEAAENLEELLERQRQSYHFMIPSQAVAVAKAIKMLREEDKK